MPAARRVVVMTPAITGMDGISEVSRAVVEALRNEAVEVWSLGDCAGSADAARTRTAAFSKTKFCLAALADSGPLKNATVVVLHVHLAPAAIPLSWRGAEITIFLHGIECWRPLSFLEKLALRNARLLVSNSHYTARRFKAANPVFAAREVRICHLGVPPMSAGREPDRGNGYALIVGRMMVEERYKGHDLLLEAWPKLLADNPGARLIIVGDGDDRPRLESKARQLGLGDAVHFEGRVTNDRLLQLYEGALFFVLPSTGEGFGLVFLEAMRAGKPCIGAPGAAEEIIQHGVTGFILPTADSAELLACMRRLFRDESLRQRLGRATRERFSGYFTRDHFCARFRSVIELDKQVAVCAG